MRRIVVLVILGLSLGLTVWAADKAVNLSGTWVLDRAKSDSGTPRPSSNRPRGSLGGGYPGGGYPGGGYPGGGYPGGGYPGGTYPGGTYPGGTYPGGTYPGGTYPGGTYPGGTNPGGTYPGGTNPRGTYPGGTYPGGTNPGDTYPGGTRGDDPNDQPGRSTDGRITDLELNIGQTDHAVEVIRKFRIRDEEQQLTQSFVIDGGQSSTPASSGRGQFMCRSTLDKDKLVNLGTVTFFEGDPEVVVKEEYSLSEKGRILTIKTTQRGPMGDFSFKQVFNRQDTSAAPK